MTFKDFLTVQVKEALYALQIYGARPFRFLRYSDLLRGCESVKVVVKAAPITYRCFCAIANYRDSHIFAVGGTDSPYIISSVDMYSIETDKWIAAPPLPKARAFLASCTLDDFLYVIGG